MSACIHAWAWHMSGSNHKPIALLLLMYVGELALEGCTVHLFDHNSLKLQTIHSTISDHLQQLKGQGLLSQEYQLKVYLLFNHVTLMINITTCPSFIYTHDLFLQIDSLIPGNMTPRY